MPLYLGWKVGLAVKIATILTNGILIGMLVESKTEVLTKVSKIEVDIIVESKIVVLTIEEHKIVEHTISIADDPNLVAEEEGCWSLVDEVVDTSINDVISCEGEKSDWTFDVYVVATIKLAEAIFKLDVAASLVGE